MGVAYDAAYWSNLRNAVTQKRPSFVSIYIVGANGTFKSFNRANIDETHANGVGILLNHERAANFLLGGAPAGAQAGREGVAAARALGAPAGTAVHYSVDVAVYGSYSAVAGAFAEIKKAHAGTGYPVGFYGQGGLGDFLHGAGLIDTKYWLSASTGFPGYNRNSPNVGMYQLVGSDVPGTDENVVVDQNSLGVWWPNGRKVDGFLMALTDQQQSDLFNHILSIRGEMENTVIPLIANLDPVIRAGYNFGSWTNDRTVAMQAAQADITAAVKGVADALVGLPAAITAGLTVPAADQAAIQAAVTTAIAPVLAAVNDVATKSFVVRGGLA